MTKLLERAMGKAQNLSPEMQDDIARVVLAYTGSDEATADLTLGEEEAVMRSRAAAARGELATDEQMQAVWAKHGL